MEGYVVKRVGSEATPHLIDEDAARRVLRDRLNGLNGDTFSTRFPPGDLSWGTYLKRGPAIDRIFAGIPDIGDRGQIRVRRDDEPRFVVKHTFSSEGSYVVRVALDQLGDEYTWASAGPNEFDCSGLVMFCYAKADVHFPVHSANGIMNDPQVNRCSRAGVRDGDLIGYHTGRLGSGQFDHIGIACWRKGSLWVIDASSTADRVVFRDADSNPILAYGFVPEITGPR